MKDIEFNYFMIKLLHAEPPERRTMLSSWDFTKQQRDDIGKALHLVNTLELMDYACVPGTADPVASLINELSYLRLINPNNSTNTQEQG